MVDILYIITLVPTVLLSSLRSDDDTFDKINYKYTVALLILFATVTATKQFDDDRIECWNRANFIKAYVQYTNQICYISSTYYVDRNSSIPEDIQKRKDSQLNYYQWTPFIILLMALSFYVPRLIWRALSVRSGIDLMDIINAAEDTKKLKGGIDNHDRLIKYIVDTIDMYVDDARRQSDAENRRTGILKKMFQLICCMTGKFLGNYFITLYFFVKIYYLFNVVLQMYLLKIFLGTNFFQFGYESLKLFRYGLNQPESKYFPRETFCDFYVREPLRADQPLQRITVQCVLTVNLFNQQIFTVLWIWYVVVFFLNAYAITVWFSRLNFEKNRVKFIKARLTRIARSEIPRFRFGFSEDKTQQGPFVQQFLIEKFLNEYLEADGYFFIRMLTVNVSNFIVQEIIEQLWASYINKYGESDAEQAEKRFNRFRSAEPSAKISTKRDGMSDVERQLKRQFTDVVSGARLLQSHRTTNEDTERNRRNP